MRLDVAEVADLYRVRKGTDFDRLHPRDLRGRFVRVVRGPWEGLEGTVVGTEDAVGIQDAMLRVDAGEGEPYRFLVTDVEPVRKDADFERLHPRDPRSGRWVVIVDGRLDTSVALGEPLDAAAQRVADARFAGRRVEARKLKGPSGERRSLTAGEVKALADAAAVKVRLGDLEAEIDRLREKLGEVEGFQSGRVSAPMQRKLRRLEDRYRELSGRARGSSG